MGRSRARPRSPAHHNLPDGRRHRTSPPPRSVGEGSGEGQRPWKRVRMLCRWRAMAVSPSIDFSPSTTTKGPLMNSLTHSAPRSLGTLAVRLVLSVVLFAAQPADSRAHHHAADPGKLSDSEPDQTLNAQEEGFIRTPPGFDKPGEPRRLSDGEGGLLTVKVVDSTTGRPAACRVNVVGPNGNYYQPVDSPLEPFNAQNAGCQANGETHPPSRYYGWHFYAAGEFRVRVPAGDIRIEVWKGYEYKPVRQSVAVQAGDRRQVRIELQRVAPMHDLGYYSGDTHIHFNRRNAEDEQQALDLIAAEDIRYGFLLAMNDPPSYSGRMDLQEWPQLRGFGPSSVLTRGNYGIASGQEYRAKTYGHICLLMHERLVLEGAVVDPNNWPVFGQIGQRTRQLGGFAFHAHGGYSQEIYADYVQEATDGVELLQMAHYRGIGLTGWYRILNTGFRFPGLAGSDFPYTRALGDCRTYVYSPKPPDFTEWARGAAEGRSFFTTGPLLLLEVEGSRPGDQIDVEKRAEQGVKARVRVRCEVTPIQRLDLIVNGNTFKRWEVPTGAGNVGTWHEYSVEIPVDQPLWIAARAHSISRTGRSDAEAHTNPVYVNVGGRQPFSAEDRDWLVQRLDERIEELAERDFAERTQALQFFRESRKRLVELSR